MTGNQLQAALDQVGLSQRKAGPFLGVHDRTVRHWIADDQPVPEAVAKLLRLMIRLHISPEEAT